MADIKGLVDDNGVIYECNKILPDELKIALCEVLKPVEHDRSTNKKIIQQKKRKYSC